MKAITCCCAPAPIDSIASTAATPKIMPSIVKRVRSLCASRLSTLRCNSGIHRLRVRFTARPRPAGPATWRRQKRSG